jgi:hypothetical protein
LARYAPNEVREDADKQRLFLKGIYYDLRLQLKGNNYASFQELVNKAIVLDNVTPQVFGFLNCIAFHKHEHHSSHSCLYFCLQHEYATYSHMLVYNCFAYEM